jgi:hypothetical protein
MKNTQRIIALALALTTSNAMPTTPNWVDIVIEAGKDLYSVYQQLMPTITTIVNNSNQQVIAVGSINQVISPNQTFTVNPAVAASVLLQPFPLHITTSAGTFSIGFNPLEMSIVVMQTSTNTNVPGDQLVIFEARTITITIDSQGAVHITGS